MPCMLSHPPALSLLLLLLSVRLTHISSRPLAGLPTASVLEAHPPNGRTTSECAHEVAGLLCQHPGPSLAPMAPTCLLSHKLLHSVLLPLLAPTEPAPSSYIKFSLCIALPGCMLCPCCAVPNPSRRCCQLAGGSLHWNSLSVARLSSCCRSQHDFCHGGVGAFHCCCKRMEHCICIHLCSAFLAW